MGHTLSLTPLDEAWLLVAACLVFTMQAGFLCLEAGLARAKHSINVAIKNLTDYLISSVAFFLIGYAVMFGKSWQGMIGMTDMMPTWTLPGQATFFFFQLVFCGTSATIVSGAMAERMKFTAYLAYAVFISAFLYPLFGHWVWGGSFYLDQAGWLARLGYLDFAGSSVVHQMGGWVALAGIIVLGPRLGKFDAQGHPRRLIGHNIPFALLGAFILWFGWFGFNGGSTLKMDAAVGGVIVNTNLAAAAGALAALAVGWPLRRRPDICDLTNGALGGLVAITASARYVNPHAALLIGAIAGPVVIAAGEWLERGLKLDDVVGAVPVHGFCGVWGILAVACFANPEFLLHPEHRLYHLGIQALGTGVCFVTAFGGGWVFFTGLDRIMGIRVSPAAEQAGLNVSEHQAISSIQQLAVAMQEITEQKAWAQRTDTDPYEDAGELGLRFNQLLETIQQTLSQLSDAKTGLEQEVHRRTQELQQVNERLEASLKDLEFSNRELEDFTHTISHDLKEPLRSIEAFSKFLTQDYQDKLDDEGRGYLERIRVNARRLGDLIEDLLELSRLSRRANQLTEVHVADLLEDVKQRLEYALKEKQAELVVQGPLPTIACDRVRLSEVFANLISNAIKYNDKPAPRIAIGYHPTEEWHQFSVADNGPGIPAEYFEKIFEVFQRLTKREDQEGTGIGLTIVKKIVELHGGRVWVESALGQGATFHFTIPKGLKRLGEILVAKQLISERELAEALTDQRRQGGQAAGQGRKPSPGRDHGGG